MDGTTPVWPLVGGVVVIDLVVVFAIILYAMMVTAAVSLRYYNLFPKARRNDLIYTLRNTPSYLLHQKLEDLYQEHLAIKTASLQNSKRYLKISYRDDLVRMERRIVVVENLDWVAPVRSSRELEREEEEVVNILTELGLANDQGDEEEEGDLLEFERRFTHWNVNP